MNQAERDQLERRPAALLGEHFARPALQARSTAAGATSATSSASQVRPATRASDTFKPAKPSTSDTSGRPEPANPARPAPGATRPAPVIGQPYDILALLLLLALLVRE